MSGRDSRAADPHATHSTESTGKDGMTSSDEVKGRVKNAVGEPTGNDDLKNEGDRDKATGKAKELIDKTADELKKALPHS